MAMYHHLGKNMVTFLPVSISFGVEGRILKIIDRFFIQKEDRATNDKVTSSLVSVGLETEAHNHLYTKQDL